MIKFINYIHENFERKFESDIERFYIEARGLLPALPRDISIYFMSDGIIHGMKTGGYAYSPDIINIAIDHTATDLDDLRAELKATVFHESYHLAHNYTGSTGPFGLLESAIHEGSATIFEQNYADSTAKDLYGNYQQHSMRELNRWLDRIKLIKNTKKMSTKEYGSIAFYDDADNIQWKLYKTGTWLVQKYLDKDSKDIKDFSNDDVKQMIRSLSQ
jgi:uncharacterized protein YjaZ